MLPLLAKLLVAVLAGAVLLLWIASGRWEAGTRELRGRLDAARVPLATARYDARELATLPPPVQRYFRAALTDGQPMVVALDLAQTGSFNQSEGLPDWKSFSATQRVVTSRPGFDWDARISAMPAIPILVHDAYVAGAGTLHASLAGVFTVARLEGRPDLAEAELLRYLAEAAWYPTALLPSQGVSWEAVDEHSARATLRDGTTTATLLFRFDADNNIASMRAEARSRSVDNTVQPMPWEGRWWRYELRDGMRVPIEGEVAWMWPAGPKPYWRGRVTRMTYEFAR